MDSREADWLIKKIGVISTSKLSLLTSETGKWTTTNISYLYSLERQRFLKQPSPQIHSRQTQLGIDNEPYAVAWLRENTTMSIKHCSEDYEEKVFVLTDWGLGCSPDVYEVSEDESEILSLIEIKTKTGPKELATFFSPTMPHARKRLMAYDDHRDQLAGQLLAHPKVDIIYLFFYDPQLDDDEWDLRSPTDPTRGVLFKYTRQEFGMYLDSLKDRIIFANNYLDSGKDILTINNEWNEYLKTK